MVDLEAMFKCADDVRTLRQEDAEYVARFLEDAATELAERRREPVAQGPGVEERLDRCRNRAANIVGRNGAVVRSLGAETEEQAVANTVENLAHAMLAAERAPTYPEVKP